MAKRDVKGLHRVVSKDREYWYAWRGGPRLRGDYGTAALLGLVRCGNSRAAHSGAGKIPRAGDALQGERGL